MAAINSSRGTVTGTRGATLLFEANRRHVGGQDCSYSKRAYTTAPNALVEASTKVISLKDVTVNESLIQRGIRTCAKTDN